MEVTLDVYRDGANPVWIVPSKTLHDEFLALVTKLDMSSTNGRQKLICNDPTTKDGYRGMNVLVYTYDYKLWEGGSMKPHIFKFHDGHIYTVHKNKASIGLLCYKDIDHKVESWVLATAPIHAMSQDAIARVPFFESAMLSVERKNKEGNVDNMTKLIKSRNRMLDLLEGVSDIPMVLDPGDDRAHCVCEPEKPLSWASRVIESNIIALTGEFNQFSYLCSRSHDIEFNLHDLQAASMALENDCDVPLCSDQQLKWDISQFRYHLFTVTKFDLSYTLVDEDDGNEEETGIEDQPFQPATVNLYIKKGYFSWELLNNDLQKLTAMVNISEPFKLPSSYKVPASRFMYQGIDFSHGITKYHVFDGIIKVIVGGDIPVYFKDRNHTVESWLLNSAPKDILSKRLVEYIKNTMQ